MPFYNHAISIRIRIHEQRVLKKLWKGTSLHQMKFFLFFFYTTYIIKPFINDINSILRTKYNCQPLDDSVNMSLYGGFF